MKEIYLLLRKPVVLVLDLVVLQLASINSSSMLTYS